MKIAIIGAGVLGTAIGGLLAARGYDVDYYDPKIERERLSKVLVDAKYVFLVAPSQVIPFLLPYFPKDKSLIVASKGFLNDAVFSDFKNVIVMSGPGYAEDFKNHRKVELTITDRQIQKLLDESFITYDYTKDRNGVLMCGSLKNVYAILAGLWELKPSTSDWRYFIQVAAEEMRDFLALNGSDPGTVDLACGIKDLKLTCSYPSRNYEYGDKLRRNASYQPEKTVEGINTIKRIQRGEAKVPESATYFKQLLKEKPKWD